MLRSALQTNHNHFLHAPESLQFTKHLKQVTLNLPNAIIDNIRRNKQFSGRLVITIEVFFYIFNVSGRTYQLEATITMSSLNALQLHILLYKINVYWPYII